MVSRVLDLQAVWSGQRMGVSLGFLALFDLFLIRVWWQGVTLAALLTNLVFVGVLVAIGYVKIWPKVVGLFGESPASNAAGAEVVLADEQTIVSAVEKLRHWLEWPMSNLPTDQPITLLLLAILVSSVASFLSVYLIVAVAVNGHFVLALLSKRNPKFDYTFSDIYAVGRDVALAVTSKIPRYNGEF